MEKVITRNAIRFVLLVLLQGLVLHRMDLGGVNFNYIHIIVYPLFILLLPVQVGRATLIALGFLVGICVDMFYDSPGLHASASVLTAFLRPIVLAYMEPRGGYKVNSVPNKEQFGTSWFFKYVAVLLTFHLLWYFMLEAFQLSQLLMIILRTICSFIASIIFMGVYVLIFNPKD